MKSQGSGKGAPDKPLRPSSVGKVQAILEAAETAFLSGGYANASMDDVSARARVSKQTIYAHFGGKQQLFVAVVAGVTADAASRVHHEIPDPVDAEALPAYLREHARRQLDVVLDERVLAVRRLVIAEADRFPQLAAAFWDQGPAKAVAEMAQRFSRFASAGLMATSDATASAIAFNWMVMGHALNGAMLLGSRGVPDADARERLAAEATRIFVAAHTCP